MTELRGNQQHAAGDAMPCGHPTTAIKKARTGAGWSYWCGECVKQTLWAMEQDARKGHPNE